LSGKPTLYVPDIDPTLDAMDLPVLAKVVTSVGAGITAAAD
jgi:hypothetical protein